MFPGRVPYTAHPPTGTPDSSSAFYKTCQDPLCARLGWVCGQSGTASSRCHYCWGNCHSCQRLQLGGIAFHKEASGLISIKRTSRAVFQCPFCQDTGIRVFVFSRVIHRDDLVLIYLMIILQFFWWYALFFYGNWYYIILFRSEKFHLDVSSAKISDMLHLGI